MTHKTEPRDPVRVLHDDCTQLPGPAGKRGPSGIARAAEMVGRSPNVLYNKFSEAMEQYEITAREALAIGHAVADETGLLGYVEAVCEQFGGVFVPMPEGMAGEDDILQAHLLVVERLGELSRVLMAARADGVIDPAEFAHLKAQGMHGVQAIHALLEEIATTVRDLPEAPVRAVK